MQGFLVSGINAVDSKFTFRYETVNRPVGNVVGNEAMRAKQNNTVKPLVTIDVEGKNSADRVYLITAETTTKGFDNGWDAYKKGSDAASAQIYVTDSSERRQQVATDSNLNDTYLGFRAGNETACKIRFKTYDAENVYSALFIHDLATGEIKQITDGLTMDILPMANYSADKRFKIIARAAGDVQTKEDAEITLQTYEKSSIRIDNNTNEEGVLTAYSVMGQPVYSVNFGKGIKVFSPAMPKGVYIWEAKTVKAKTTLKAAML